MKLALLNTKAQPFLAPFVQHGILTPADVYPVDILAARLGEHDPETLLGLMLAVRAPRVGHIGVDLHTVEQQIDIPPRPAHEPPLPPIQWPEDRSAWLAKIRQSPMLKDNRPFVIDTFGPRQYLMTSRMASLQDSVAARLLTRLQRPNLPPPADLDTRLDALYPPAPNTPNEGAHAVRVAARGHLSLITGGPGTGKTYSIKRLLTLLFDTEDAQQPLRVALAAPTGKAAQRMKEAMGEDLDALPTSDSTKERLRNLEPQTLHKLLGTLPSGLFRHNEENPLPVDLLIVDEVSMVDLLMMDHLLAATPPDARLILLGDQDQLASVEAGSVLADLVRARHNNPRLTAQTVTFSHSFRFGTSPNIAEAAQAIRQGEPASLDLALAYLEGKKHADNEWLRDRIQHLGSPPGYDTGHASGPTETQLAALTQPYIDFAFEARDDTPRHGYIHSLCALYRDNPAHLRAPEHQRALLLAHDHYRILAAHRRGPLGIGALETAVSLRIRAHLNATLGPQRPDTDALWLGRPILITQNDYDIGLFNGDTGLILPNASGELVAVFPQSEGTGIKHVGLSRLPAHEGGLVMTIHKSQGSQFGRVAIVLAGRPSPIQTRELVYTALTRARVRVDWLGSPDELSRALHATIQRASGLDERLHGAPTSALSG